MIRSAAYRIAIIYSSAFALATLALGLGVYAAAHVALRGQLEWLMTPRQLRALA